MSTSTLIGLALVIAFVVYIIMIYNRLVALRNRFRNGFSQIDVQLQRRHDLIPNLVETARTYLEHERETLTRVTEARHQAVSAQQQASGNPDNAANIQKLAGAENLLSRALANFYAVSENYPDLKANQTLQQLMEELSSTENKVSFARQAYNDAVMAYNTYREQFPNNILAGMFAFLASTQLELENPEARQAPKVSFR